jgi:hypothetical protein
VTTPSQKLLNAAFLATSDSSERLVKYLSIATAGASWLQIASHLTTVKVSKTSDNY